MSLVRATAPREVLEYIPVSLKVIEHIRPKLSCRACETIVQAPMPSLPIERGLPGPGLLAHIAISKFCATCRSIGRARCMPARASSSIAR